MTVTKKPEGDDAAEKLKLRAARFGDVAGFSSGPSTTTVSPKVKSISQLPEDAEKLAKRAARFKDCPAEPEKLAARAARFADVKGFTPSSVTSTASVTATSNTVDPDKLAKRAARFKDCQAAPDKLAARAARFDASRKV